MHLAVHHLAVRVSDLDAGVHFYRDVLNLPVQRVWNDELGQPRSFWLDLPGGCFLAVERANCTDPRRADESPGWHCIALSIEREKRELWRARLAEAGFPVHRETAFTIYTRDPEGTIVGLSHYPTPVENPTRLA